MRIRTHAGLFGILVCVSILCPPIPKVWSQTNSSLNGVEPASGERNSRSTEVLLTPQQLQEQHQQLLKAIELIRQDTQVHLQRFATAVDRIRKDTDASLKRFTVAVDGKLDRLNRTVASEREHDLQTLSNSSRFTLTIAAVVVGLLLFDILLLAWFSVRAVNRVATQVSTWISQQPSYDGASAVVGMETHALTGNRAEKTSLRLQYAIERLEQRLLDLEHATNRIPTTLSAPPVAQVAIASATHLRSHVVSSKPGKASGVSLAVGQGESLIFLPHEQEITPLHRYRNVLQKLRKRFQPERVTKGD